MRTVVATAEIPQPKGSRWQIERQKQQLREWFGGEVDFVITLSAPLLAAASDRDFCAVVEHELFHCAQAEDEFGQPRFSKATGRPIYAIRGHDCEEFVGVVRRYGASGDVRALVAAATAGPRVADAEVAYACGTCARRVA